jgi:uncharacterized protein
VRCVLVDAGPLIALFSEDKNQARFSKRIRELADENARLLTTWPCVTEATYLVPRLNNRLALMRWLAEGGAIAREFPATALEQMASWVERYSDRRDMDFADASLMWLAVETPTREILTTDRNDFERYRLPGNKRFEIV